MSLDKKIVIDTGTLISASIRVDSIPSKAYIKALREFTICVSDDTFSELDRVIRRKKFDTYLDIEDRISFLASYRERAVWYAVTQSVFDCRDINDNKFLELALATGSEIIVSSDPDLYLMNPYRNIAILKPADFLNYDT
jgi:uncharacterized protein